MFCLSFVRRHGRPFAYNTVFSYAGPDVIKLFFMLNSTDHEISAAHKKTKILTNEEVFCFKSLRCCIYHAHKC